MSEEVTIIPISNTEQLQAAEKAVIDTQIATAKQYPRDIQRATNDSIVIATMNKETAESCGYALPRGGKPIQGPSVHLARIIAQNWTNLRVEAKVIEITSTQVVCQAVCFDLQTNYAVKVEVRRSIIDRYGKRFKDDMITVTGNAGNAIAYRNAVFSVIPKSVHESVYQETKNMITGDLSDEAKLIKKRKNALKTFKDMHGVTEEQILKAVGVGSVNGINQDQIILLAGFLQSIKDGDSTVDQIFKREENKNTPLQKKKDLKDKKPNKVDLP